MAGKQFANAGYNTGGSGGDDSPCGGARWELEAEVILASLLMYIAVSCNSEKGVFGLSLC